MELTVKDYPYKDKKLSFTIKEKEINGISGNNIEEIINSIRINPKKIKINHKEMKAEDWNQICNKIIFIPEWIKDSYHELTIEEIMIEYIKVREIYPKNLKKKLKDSLKIVGLPEELLERNIYACSTSEQKCIQLAIALLSNPDMLILEEPFRVLDLKTRKKIMMVLKRIKDTYKKTIVIISNNPEVLLKETDHLLIIKNNRILVEDKTLDAYKNVDLLKKHKVDIPEIIEFTYLAQKNKKAKIGYFKDIRDLIKDIYKHV